MDMTELKSKANGLFAKLPFRAWAEKIPAGARAKFPLLEKAIPFANQIAAGLAAVLVVTVIACSGGGSNGGGKQYAVTGLGEDWALYIRSEPEMSDDNMITELTDGDTVTLLEEGEMFTNDEGITAPWFKVRTADGTEGWAFSGYLAASESPKGKAQAAAQKEAAAAQKSAVLAPESDFNVSLELRLDNVTITSKGPLGDLAVITGYTGPGGNIIIPATIQGLPVWAVNMNPPMQKVGTGRYITNDTINSIQDVDNFGKKQEIMKDANASLISVVIPEGVRWVGGFQDCAALRSVTLPDSVTTIAAAAFQGCTSLASITIPEGVTEIGGSAFQGCTSLTTITIPGSVKTMGKFAFSGCTSLASVVISEGVTEIAAAAFQGCTSLASVVISEGVTEIGGSAFQGCTSLASVTIPDSVTMIDNAAFQGCTSLTTVTISPIKRERVDNAFKNCPKLSLASQAALRAAGYRGGFD